jgi:hypothetical protein
MQIQGRIGGAEGGLGMGIGGGERIMGLGRMDGRLAGGRAVVKVLARDRG